MIKKTIIIILLFLVSLIIISLIWGDSDLEVIEGKYKLFKQSNVDSQIMYSVTYDLDSLSIYKYLKNNIYPTVEKFVFHNDYILVKQRPKKDLYQKAIIWEYESIFTNEKSKIVTDSIINRDPYFQKIFKNRINYWIIDVKKEILYGPFNLNEFNSKKKQLSVSIDLR